MKKQRLQRFYHTLAEARKAAKSRHMAIVSLGRRGAPQYYVGTPTKETMKRFKDSTAYLGLPIPKVIEDYRV